MYRIPGRINDARYSVKWGFQRMFRGHDDPMVWGYQFNNAEQTLTVLKKLQEIKHGSPGTDDPDNVLKTKGDINCVDDSYHERWEEALALMIDGWQAMIDMDDVHIKDKKGKYDPKATIKELKRLEKVWNKGMTLYVANYRGLWD